MKLLIDTLQGPHIEQGHLILPLIHHLPCPERWRRARSAAALR